MNWSRGLFRLWVAFSCLWIGTATVSMYLEAASPRLLPAIPADVIWTKPDHPAAKAEFRASPYDNFSSVVSAPARPWLSDLIKRYIFAGVLPPFILLAIAFVIRWIGLGFKRHP